MTRQDIGVWLSWFFVTVLYPAVVVAVFISILLLLITVVRRAADFPGRLRRGTGALLPLVAFRYRHCSNGSQCTVGSV
jgi:MFS superfamily sulfate permease-like transporter